MKVRAEKQLIYRGRVVPKYSPLEMDDEDAEKLSARNLVKIMEEEPKEEPELKEEVPTEDKDISEAKAEYQKLSVPQLKEMATEVGLELPSNILKDEIINKLVEAEFN